MQPSTNRASPGLAKAIAFLRAEYGNAGLATGQDASRRLSLRTAARRAGVAYMTMWRAAHALQSSGVLDIRHGRGMEPAGTKAADAVTAPRPSPGPRASRAHLVRDRILADIESGRLGGDDRLPGTYKLAARYGSCYRVVRASLESLAFSGIVVAHGSGYRAANLGAGRPGAAIALIVWTHAVDELLGKTHRRWRLYSLLEDESSLRNVRIEKYAYMDHPGFVQGAAGRSIALSRAFEGRSDLLGFAVIATGIPPSDDFARFLRRMGEFGKPIAILDEAGRHHAAPAGVPGTHVFVSAGTTHCGQAMGRYLMALGHRHVAYISAYHGTQWSRNRLLGLRSVFDETGMIDAVTAHVIERETFNPELDVATDARRLSAQLRRTVTGLTLPSEPKARLVRRCVRSLSARIDEVVQSELVRDYLTPLFSEALNDPLTTAWVTVNDAAGLQAVGYLRRHGVTVPADISVVGFDNTPEAFVGQLSSYDFNERAAVQAMMKHIAGPGARTGGVTQIDGFVARRGSSGPCHPRKRRNKTAKAQLLRTPATPAA